MDPKPQIHAKKIDPAPDPFWLFFLYSGSGIPVIKRIRADHDPKRCLQTHLTQYRCTQIPGHAFNGISPLFRMLVTAAAAATAGGPTSPNLMELQTSQFFSI